MKIISKNRKDSIKVLRIMGLGIEFVCAGRYNYSMRTGESNG